MKYVYVFFLIVSFYSHGETSPAKEDCDLGGETAEVVDGEVLETYHGIADHLNDLIVNDASNESPLKNLCNALKVSTNETMLQLSLDTFKTNIQHLTSTDSKLGELIKSLKTNESKEIDDKLFFDKLVYELKCPNNGDPIYIYHYLLLENPVLIDELIAKSDNKIQKEQFAAKREYNGIEQDLLALAKSYLPEMKKSVLKRVYIGAIRSIKGQVERDE